MAKTEKIKIEEIRKRFEEYKETYNGEVPRYLDLNFYINWILESNYKIV